MNKRQTKLNYGNWVSIKLIYGFGAIGILFLVLSFMFLLLSVVAALSFLAVAYFIYARYKFSPRGGDLQAKIRNVILDHLNWDGKGTALDIGCGNAPLTIGLAKKYPESQVTGIDYWGGKWEYSKTSCEENAANEGVATRTLFQKASASKLPFEDDYFDAAVSNFVFHEVSDTQDKRRLIKEALRVVKKGGKFAFQDLFLIKKIYGDTDLLLKDIRSWGVEDVQFVDTSRSDFIPTALRLPFMVGAIGIIYGTK